jgi:hypothetical protein
LRPWRNFLAILAGTVETATDLAAIGRDNVLRLLPRLKAG